MADGLQQMGLTKAHGGVKIKRIVDRRLAGRRRGDALGRRMGELVRLAHEEGREGQAPIKRRACEAISVGGRLHAGRALGVGGAGLLFEDRRRTLRRKARRGGQGAARLGAAGLRRKASGGRGAGGGADVDGDGGDGGGFGRQGGEDLVRIVGLNPALEKTGGDRQKSDAVADRVKLKAAEPGREDVFTQFCAQAAAGPFPGFGMVAVAIGLCLRSLKARRGRAGVHHVRRLLFSERGGVSKKQLGERSGSSEVRRGEPRHIQDE